MKLGEQGEKYFINDGFHAFSKSVGRYLRKDSHLNHYQRWIRQNEPKPDELIN